jgi:hypothetical protein
VNYKWTLIYNGETKIYTLTQYQLVGEEWYKMGTTEWSYIDAPLEHMRKLNHQLLGEERRQG